MVIAIASGKGGVGKTIISTALALSVCEPVNLLDCDVEEPNTILFFQDQEQKISNSYIKVPSIIADKCKGCGVCAKFCKFKAIAIVDSKAVFFSELCHNCGGCGLVCPEKAIIEEEFIIGKLIEMSVNDLKIYAGELKIGYPLSPPLIRIVKSKIDKSRFNIVDAPPGTSCPMAEAIKQVDYVIIVAEPTPFGLNDLQISLKAVRQQNIPFGIVVNRFNLGDSRVEQFCHENNLEILMKIPNDRAIAEQYSHGINHLVEKDIYRNMVMELIFDLKNRVYK